MLATIIIFARKNRTYKQHILILNAVGSLMIRSRVSRVQVPRLQTPAQSWQQRVTHRSQLCTIEAVQKQNATNVWMMLLFKTTMFLCV